MTTIRIKLIAYHDHTPTQTKTKTITINARTIQLATNIHEPNYDIAIHIQNPYDILHINNNYYNYEIQTIDHKNRAIFTLQQTQIHPQTHNQIQQTITHHLQPQTHKPK